MKRTAYLLFGAAMAFCAVAHAQQVGQPELKIDSANRTLSVSASESVSVEPDLAILHVGFETQPQDAKSAYADGAQTSNAIISAVKQAGIADSAIHSESQFLNRDPDSKQRKYRLQQSWTIKVSPERAAEILDAAVSAGANSSGDIDWTIKDEKALEQQVLEKAAVRAREDAAVLAKGMGVRLGNLVFVRNDANVSVIRPMSMMRVSESAINGKMAPPLAIEPHTVTRTATVYAVFAIE